MLAQPGYRLGVDIGGTFTDVVLLDGDGGMRTRKVLSTPDDYARGVLEGALGLLEEAGLEPAEVTGIVHATTVASNTVLEGQGARTARSHYGVVLGLDPPTVDEPATAALRETMRR